MNIFKCKMCGGTLEVSENQSTAVCEYCGTKQTIPKLDDERRAQMYDRANHFRRSNDFDKAMGIYERILNEDNTDAEAYWSLVLCRYGIEYVEDPKTHKRVPTVNRVQYTSIFDDEDYKSALKYADGYQYSIYEEEAKTINEIQKGILLISQKEEPFDVFICYKETDNSGKRTKDSVIANDLYHHLTKEGFKVFFSKITLEDKIGTAYEPYIFAALNSAKVMVVISTKPEYVNAVWVKNEWSRFLALIKNGANKVLIPAYKGMDPYDLPDEFSHLQALDMDNIGFMQDLIRGIKKLTTPVSENNVVNESNNVNNSSSEISPLLTRAFMYLEDGDWESADNYCERVLDMDPKNGKAYLGKLMAQLRVNWKSSLKDQKTPFYNNSNYQKIMRFGDEALKKELKSFNEYIEERNEHERLEDTYNNAVRSMEEAFEKTKDEEKPYEAIEDYENAVSKLREIPDYKDASALIEECNSKIENLKKEKIYLKASKLFEDDIVSNIEMAKKQFESILEYKDSYFKAQECLRKINEIEGKRKDDILAKGKKLVEKDNVFSLKKAIQEFKKIEGWKDASYQIEKCNLRIEDLKVRGENKRKKALKITLGLICFVIVIFGVFKGYEYYNKIDSYNEGIALMNSGKKNEAMLKFIEADGIKDSDNLYKKLYKELYGEIYNNNVISDGGMHTAGLKSDGKVIVVGYNKYGQCDVSEWKDMVAISAGRIHTVGLKKDGTVLAVGDIFWGECDVSKWKDIVSVSAGGWHTVGLKSDGKVVAVGYNKDGECDVSEWRDIVSISAGKYHSIGLKSDGTVVAVGNNDIGQCNVENWKGIIAISAGDGYTIGLKEDGTVVAVGDYRYGQCNVSEWKDIIAISAGGGHSVGLKSDGTVVAVGDNTFGQCDVENWKGIVAISAGYDFTVGLKSDGTVVAVGNNDNGQCNVENFIDIKLPTDINE